jgi:hypothetical protein
MITFGYNKRNLEKNYASFHTKLLPKFYVQLPDPFHVRNVMIMANQKGKGMLVKTQRLGAKPS